MFRTTNDRFRIRKFTAPARLCTAALLLFLLPMPAVPAENWPQWRGPSGNGISDSSDLPVHWTRDKNIAWKAKLSGLGASSPIVWENTVFVTSQLGKVPLRQGSFPLLARDDRELVRQTEAQQTFDREWPSPRD